MDTVLKKYNIKSITKNGTKYYDIENVAVNICNIKNNYAFRRKMSNRIKINKIWFAPIDNIVISIKSCGRRSAKRFVKKNQKYMDQYLDLGNDSKEESKEESENESEDESENDSESDSEEKIIIYDIVNLKKSEKMKDNNGNIIEIEEVNENIINVFLKSMMLL